MDFRIYIRTVDGSNSGKITIRTPYDWPLNHAELIQIEEYIEDNVLPEHVKGKEILILNIIPLAEDHQQ